MSTPISRSRRIAGAITVSALAIGSTLAAGALSPAAAVTPILTGSITGTVVGAAGAIPGASVEINGDTDLDGNYNNFYGWMSAGASGDYYFNHLPAGKYRIEYYAAGYDGEYYADASDSSLATPVTVGTGNTPVPAVSLATSAAWPSPDANTEITGVLTDSATGKPLAGAYVTAYNAAGDDIDWSSTDVTGRYKLDDLQGSGPVKLEFYRSGGGALNGYRSLWSGGARTRGTATAVAITPGTSVTVSAALTQYAGISGKVVNAAGAVPYGGSVSALDADSNYVNDAEIRPDGTYYLNNLNPGEEYRVVVNSAYDYPGNDSSADRAYYYDTWYTNGNSFASATPLTAGAPGAWTPSINFALSNTLVALDLPSISGDAVIGKTLTGNKGRWNRNGNSTFGYEWLRGATVVGTASTYTLTAADAGQSISLRVTNTNFDTDLPRSVSATTAAKVAKFSSVVSAKAKKIKKGKKAGASQVTVSVKAGPAAGTTGTVKVTEGKKKVATLKVKNGTAKFVVKKAGKHHYTLTYSGNGTTLADTGKATVKVKKAKKAKKKK